MVKKKSKKKNWLILGIILLVLLAIFFIYNSFMITSSFTEGKVIDAITKEPVERANVKKIISGRSFFGFEGSLIIISEESVYTNSEGMFAFDKKLFFKSLLATKQYGGRYIEKIWINKKTTRQGEKPMPINENYFYSYLYFGGDTNRPTSNIIELMPKVNDIDNCGGNDLCIELNAYALAFKTGDKSLCKRWDPHRIERCESYLDILTDPIAFYEEKLEICDHTIYLATDVIEDGDRMKQFCLDLIS